MGNKLLISLAVVTAALAASVPQLSQAHALPASALMQPMSNGNGGGP